MFIRKVFAFLRGMWEFRRSWTWADPSRSYDDPYTALDAAYDCGRDFAHRITFHVWDDL